MELLKIVAVAFAMSCLIAIGHHWGKLEERGRWVKWYSRGMDIDDNHKIFIPDAEWLGEGKTYVGAKGSQDAVHDTYTHPEKPNEGDQP